MNVAYILRPPSHGIHPHQGIFPLQAGYVAVSTGNNADSVRRDNLPMGELVPMRPLVVTVAKVR